MTAPKPQTLKFWLTAGVLLAALAGLAGVALATGWEESWATLRRLSLVQVLVLLALSLLNYGCRGLRWHLYTRAMAVPTTLSTNLVHYIGGFALTATPGRLGELVRLRWIWRVTGLRPDRTGALVLIDRAADLTSIGLLLALCIAIFSAGQTGGLLVAGAAVLLALIVTRPGLLRRCITLAWRTLGLFPRLFAGFRRAARGLAVFSDPAIFAPATLLGIVGWCAEGVAFFALLAWLGADVSFAAALTVFCLSVLTGGATGLPGGIGGAEAAMVAGLALHGVPLEIALPATAVIRLTTLWFAILLGMVAFPIAERHTAQTRTRTTTGHPAHALE